MYPLYTPEPSHVSNRWMFGKVKYIQFIIYLFNKPLSRWKE